MGKAPTVEVTVEVANICRAIVNRPHDRAPRERASSGRISIFKIKSDHTVYSRLCTVGDGHI